MPAERTDALGHALDVLGSNATGENQVVADAADAPFVHRLQFGVGNAVVDDGNAAARGPVVADRVQRHGVVGAVERRLHDHRALDPEHLVHGLVGFQRRRRRGVVALGHEGLDFLRRNDVRVAVAGSRRQRVLRRRGVLQGSKARPCHVRLRMAGRFQRGSPARVPGANKSILSRGLAAAPDRHRLMLQPRLAAKSQKNRIDGSRKPAQHPCVKRRSLHSWSAHRVR